MLKLTKKADYGLIALKHLAVNAARGSSSAKEIADCYGIPLPLLSKILQKLGKAGFLRSEQGTNGGYKLSRNASEITALDVIRSIDAGTNTFFVLDPNNGKRSEVGVIRTTGRDPYVRTHADGDWNDNLQSLNQCTL